MNWHRGECPVVSLRTFSEVTSQDFLFRPLVFQLLYMAPPFALHLWSPPLVAGDTGRMCGAPVVRGGWHCAIGHLLLSYAKPSNMVLPLFFLCHGMRLLCQAPIFSLRYFPATLF